MGLMRKMALGLAAVALVCSSAAAFINPNFTPIDLVKQSDVIVTVEIKGVDKDGLATATVTKVIQGKFADKEIKIDLMAGVAAADGKAVIERINDGHKVGVLFVGAFHENDVGDSRDRGGDEAKGFLHLGGMWEILTKGKGNSWDMEKTDNHMLGTWSGGTDMLLGVVDYVKSDPEATVPVREGLAWGKEIKVGKIEGKVYAVAGVDLEGKGKADLFVAAEKGDHLFRWNGKAFEDVTEKVGLKSKSEKFAWGDYYGNGHQSLASWDGNGLTIFSLGNDDKFIGKTLGKLEFDTLLPPKDGCMGLTTFSRSNKGGAALLFSTKVSPLVLSFVDRTTAVVPLLTGEFPGKDLGEAGECVVADFDGDGQPDIMQMFSGGALFYKGMKAGEFAAPVKMGVGFGEGRHGVCVGDWEGSGRLDIFTCAENRNHLWHNLGGGKFVEAIDKSGSVSYIAKPGATFCQTAAFNGDGRQGLIMVYESGIGPQLYFNRGFRSFGLCRELEKGLKDVPQAESGEQAGCLGDFRGEGALGQVLVPANGEIWYLPQKIEEKAMGVVVSLSPASPNAGPVMVWVSRDKRAFGAAAIRAGEAGVLYGLKEAGPVTVKWQFPGGAVQQKEVIVEDKVVRVVIDKVVVKQEKK